MKYEDNFCTPPKYCTINTIRDQQMVLSLQAFMMWCNVICTLEDIKHISLASPLSDDQK